MTTKAAPENAASASADARPAPQARLVRGLAYSGVFIVLFGLASLLSWLCRPGPAKEPASEPGAHQPVEMPQKKIVADATPAEILQRGDSALIDYRFSHAIAHYEELLQTNAIGAPAVAYRLGLCSEMLDRVDTAIGHYRSALSATTSAALSFTCQVGIARCFLRQDRVAESRRVLYPLLLDESKQRDVPPALAADARSLLALAWSRQVQAAPANPLALDVFVPFSQVSLETPIYLDAAGKPADTPVNAEPPKPQARLVVEKAIGPKATRVKEIEQSGRPVKDLLDRLAAGAGWRIQWTPLADAKVKDRAVHVNVRHWDLADLLDCLTDQFGLLWRIDGEVIFFVPQEGDEAVKDDAIREGVVRRALIRASEAAPEHLYAPAVFLELGNLEAAAGTWDDAARWYERSTRDFPTSPYVVLARYNLAQIHLRNKDFLNARRTLYQVVDQSPAHEFALRAYLRLGQLLLTEEENREAIVCLRRAQALAPRSPFRPIATLTLAAALLKFGDPAAAHRVMDLDRAVLHQEQYKPTATFLDAYAKYRMAKPSDSSRREAVALLSTLWHYREATLIGQLGKYLIAEAYADLSFPQEAERVLTKASAQAQGTVMTCIEFRLGEILLKKGQIAAAKERFEKIAQSARPYRPQALYHLARIDLSEKRWKDCAAKCERIWREQSFADSGLLLQLWGAALEGAGDYARAAQCFAGKAPL